MKGSSWHRIRPERQKLVQYQMMRLLFDGDHAMLNRYTVRGRTTVGDVMQAAEDWEKHQKEKRDHRESLEQFQQEAAKGSIFINLKHVQKSLFYSGVDEDEFWRVVFEVYRTSCQEITEEESQK